MRLVLLLLFSVSCLAQESRKWWIEKNTPVALTLEAAVDLRGIDGSELKAGSVFPGRGNLLGKQLAGANALFEVRDRDRPRPQDPGRPNRPRSCATRDGAPVRAA